MVIFTIIIVVVVLSPIIGAIINKINESSFKINRKWEDSYPILIKLLSLNLAQITFLCYN